MQQATLLINYNCSYFILNMYTCQFLFIYSYTHYIYTQTRCYMHNHIHLKGLCTVYKSIQIRMLTCRTHDNKLCNGQAEIHITSSHLAEMDSHKFLHESDSEQEHEHSALRS